MKRIGGIVMVWAVIAAGLAIGNPARPLYVPEPKQKPPMPVQVDVRGSEWLGKYTVGDRYYTFETDGTVSYRSSPAVKNTIKNRGNWKLEGKQFSFDHNVGVKAIIHFQGTIMDKDTIVGEQTMLNTGKKMDVTMKRKAP